MRGLLEHLDGFHKTFLEAVQQRQAIEATLAGRFAELLAGLHAGLAASDRLGDSNGGDALNSFRSHLQDIESSAEALWSAGGPSPASGPDFEQANRVLERIADTAPQTWRASAESDLEELRQLYRQLLQRSRGHQFLVNVVMAGEAHEMQMLAELLEEELSTEIAVARDVIDRQLRAFALGLIALLVLGSVLVFLVGRAMANSVSGQIRRLSRIFSELAAGSEAPIRFDSVHRDEIGELARAAERFREENIENHQLLDRYRALNEELESKVVQRTRALASSNERLEHLANTDRLTGVCNRRALDGALNAEVERCRRYEHSLALLFLDLDHFKQVNDVHGHAVGDKVLQQFVVELRSLLRDSDVLGRWGGEEFIVMCPETASQDAVHLAERIRSHVADLDFPIAGRVTVSIGVADFRPGDRIQDLVDRADQALYRAKLQGRNRLVAA